MRFDRLLFINKNDRGGSNRRTSRLNQSRSISCHSLQNLLMGGILAFAIGIFVMYTHLMKIEQNVHTELADGRLHYSSANKKREGTSYINKEDPNSWFHKNNNHHNPGRAYWSERGKVKCDQDIYKLVSYWNDPRSIVDREFQSPFLEPPSAYIQRPKKTRYLSFEPDLVSHQCMCQMQNDSLLFNVCQTLQLQLTFLYYYGKGGWNNIRMEFEIMVLLAAATGRTLVLPPDNPLYLLSLEKKNKHRGLQNFFHDFSDVVETISTEDFFQKEIIDHSAYQLPMDEKNRTRLLGSLEQCYWMKKHDHSCIYLYEYMKEIADFIPNWHGEHNCLIMDDENWFKYDVIGASDEVQKQRIKKFCANRTPIYYNNQMHGASLIHFHSHNKDTRLLVHFYAFIYFTNPKIGNYYKRLVRDRVRYSDEIQCAAGKIVRSLIEESMGRYFNGAGAEAGYFSMHIRRGKFFVACKMVYNHQLALNKALFMCFLL